MSTDESDITTPHPTQEKPRLSKLLEAIKLPFEMGIFLAGALWGLALVLSVAAYTGNDAGRMSIGMLAAFAASSIGGLVGFLFGVPKGPSEKPDAQRDVGNLYRPNTNLEQVSDWLTKIIVGVGLIQFRQIGSVIGDVGQAVGAAIGDEPGLPGSGAVFAIGLMVASAVFTFLLAYMWTTTKLFHVYTEGIRADGKCSNSEAIEGPTAGQPE